jgi:signal transduction histidine kinase
VAHAAPPVGAPASEPVATAGAPVSQQATSLHRLSAAVAHEVGNPLVGIRTYAALLPSRFDDAEFRAHFVERVEADTRRIESVIETLARLGGFPQPARAPVDLSLLIAGLLELERPRIRERRLVVLEELERTQPNALGDADQLRFAFAYLIEQALGWVPERGDLYVSTRHLPASATRPATLRVTLRLNDAGGGLGLAEHSLAVSALEEVVLAHGGTLSLESAPTGETVLTTDLPA